MRLRFQKGDILAIAIVLLMAVVVFAGFIPAGSESAACAEIYLEGERVQTVSLSESQEFTITSKYSNTIRVKDGQIAIVQSDCPGEDCVHSGWIRNTGRSIVCLPNELEIRIIAGDGNGGSHGSNPDNGNGGSHDGGDSNGNDDEVDFVVG